MNRLLLAAAAAGLAATVPTAGSGQVTPDCSTLANPTYVSGSSAIEPLVKRLSPIVAATTTLVYKGAGSCTGVAAIVTSTPITGTARYYDNAGNALTCNLPAGGQLVDVGVSDVFVETCGYTKPPTVGDFSGPYQAMLFVVPKASSAQAITAEEAYYVYGFGANLTIPTTTTVPAITPWTQTSSIWRRDQNSGTEQIIGHAIFDPTIYAGNIPGVKIDAALPSPSGCTSSTPPCQNTGGSGGMVTKVSSDPNPNAAIGILGADFYDSNRNILKSLAFRGYGQTVAYWADSSPTSFDKRNVRDGRYQPMGPLHMIANVDNYGIPTSIAAASLIGWITGTTALPSGDLIDLEIQSNVVPLCAMNVDRSSDGGPLSPTSGASCGCYYDWKITHNAPSCATCAADADCGTGGPCRKYNPALPNTGYCEAR